MLQLPQLGLKDQLRALLHDRPQAHLLCTNLQTPQLTYLIQSLL
uniref:Uncharacterized protein n=1 Tax=Rhizophora mucronata TaxID=61149 RepID=A0A2P2JFK1_RHIMU